MIFRLITLLLFFAGHKHAISQKINFTSAGHARSFILHLPRSYVEHDSITYPVLICLHGKGSNGREMKMYTGLNAVADTSGLIMAYPTTAGDLWPYADTGDIHRETTYLNDIMQYIADHYKGDPQQVYMCGMSSGGIFTFTYASIHPSKLKGIAVVSGNISLAARGAIEKNRSILPPLLLIHGTGDFLYHGKAGVCISAEESLTTYLSGCDERAPDVEWLPDTHPKDKCTVEKSTFTCPKKMAYYRIHNGGHHWPGAAFNAALFTSIKLGKYCRDFKANEAIRSFIMDIDVKNHP